MKILELIVLINICKTEFENQIVFKDYWNDDLAVGMMNVKIPNKLLYISYLNHCWHYEVEQGRSPEDIEKGNIEVIEKGEAEDSSEMRELIKLHLNLNLNTSINK
ncbi:hypothetical protein [Hugenholtzia roseola]|uniref:hypothetical protein n=1 Tax=Hugenholtzia roseola TaxID=1002 RepID=UPI000424CFD8|nr:hypothetical protein [Hugenholtzia roseola]